MANELEGKKFDGGKLRFDLIPPGPLEEVAFVFTLGAEVYTDRNWETGIKWGRVFGAMMRHSWAFWRGEKYDRACLNPKCIDTKGARNYLPPEAGSNRFMECPICYTNGKRQHHLSSVVWCAMALMEYEHTHPELDDRSRPFVEIKVLMPESRPLRSVCPECSFTGPLHSVRCSHQTGHRDPEAAE